MNIHTQIKTLALLCTLPLSNSFASQALSAEASAKEEVKPHSLEAKLAAIDAIPDHEMLSMVVPVSQERAEQWLMEAKNELKQDPFFAANQLPKKHAKTYRLAHKYWATHNELELCNDNQYLKAQRDGFGAQCNVAGEESQETASALRVNQTMPLSAYNYQLKKSNVYQFHASLLLAKNEKLQQKESLWLQKEMQWQRKESLLQQEKAQWLEEKQLLSDQQKRYQILVNDQPIQDMADAPPPYEESSSSSK